MEIGIPREGSNERTRARRARRKASKARKKAAEEAVAMTRLVVAKGELPFIPRE